MCRFHRPLKIRGKGRYTLILKAITMIDPATGWFEITQYNNNKEMEFSKLVETTWLVQYLWIVEITYDRGGEFFSNEFKKH